MNRNWLGSQLRFCVGGLGEDIGVCDPEYLLLGLLYMSIVISLLITIYYEPGQTPPNAQGVQQYPRRASIAVPKWMNAQEQVMEH